MSPHIRCTCGQILPLVDEPRGRNVECPGCGVAQFVPNLASVVALSNARGLRAAPLRFEGEPFTEGLPFLDEDSRRDQDEGYEPSDFNFRRPR